MHGSFSSGFILPWGDVDNRSPPTSRSARDARMSALVVASALPAAPVTMSLAWIAPAY
jgi:hypothetical protein